jgi:transcriptional regulator with XRE-family HTH domain
VQWISTSIDPEAAQLLDARRYTMLEVAMMLGVPLTMLGDLSRGTYTNTEQQELQFRRTTIAPIAENWQQELDCKLTPDDSYEWKFYFHSLDNADTTAKLAYYQSGRNWGWLTANEIRENEHLQPVPHGDETIQPLNMVPMGEPPAQQPATEPQPTRATEEDDDTESRGRRSVHLPVWVDCAKRMLTKESKAVQGACKMLRSGDTEGFVGKVSSFHETHNEHLRGNFAPPVESLGHSYGVHDAATVETYCQRMADRWTRQAKETVAELLTRANPAEEIEKHCAAMSDRAKDVGKYEMKRARDYLRRCRNDK